MNIFFIGGPLHLEEEEFPDSLAPIYINITDDVKKEDCQIVRSRKHSYRVVLPLPEWKELLHADRLAIIIDGTDKEKKRWTKDFHAYLNRKWKVGFGIQLFVKTEEDK